MSSTTNATWRIPSVFAGACRLPPWLERVELRQLESPMAVRGLQHRNLCPDAVEPYPAVHPPALDRPLALQLESEFDKELGCGREVVNHDAYVFHPFDQGGSPSSSRPVVTAGVPGTEPARHSRHPKAC